MVVYIEQVVLDNLIVNFILLFLTGKLIFNKINILRIILSDIIGTIFSVVYPFVNIVGILLIASKVVLGIIMILVAFKSKNLKKYITAFFCFLIFTGVVGGLAFAFVFAIYPNATFQEGVLCYKGLPMGIFLFVVFLLLKIVYDLFLFVKKKKSMQENICCLRLKNKKISFKINAYIDTGNLLSFNEKPVVIISFFTFKKLFNISNQDFLLGKYKIDNSQYINSVTANANSKMLVFDIEKVELCKRTKYLLKEDLKIIDCYLGLTLADLENKFGCGALIGSFALN